MIERRGAIRYNFGAVAEVFGLEEPRGLVSIAQDRTRVPSASPVVSLKLLLLSPVGSVTANVSATGMGVVFTEIEASERAVLGKWMENPE